ncbi:P-loop containing nucleoside triphosphate hydrolase protein [Gloeophyllum trabeum ATCC 11539]|uniref:p-loop containing nucleoside triphosphate hydrolase protein n=1 Tax=Gloeophyllum trabeum (strain ATCC 11539 / FP-39264 / Madison 617) TaxID=670483 RepID=S7RXL7_GLOTA|nr:P-loop containing nucleoside triphosphate hydrolase protein [Gloeophyllum trabeum ATCC 11539]EPQ58104.1 P-loop containing nucleoside triphosphate hydrolase protein [Gloeophyllum trabeum ATCC 11539]
MSAMSETLLELREISCARSDGSLIFSDATFDVKEGDVLVLRGKSGAGKSTLLKCIAHLNVYKGEVLYRGRTPKAIGVPLFRTRVLYVPQRPSLLPGTPKDFFNTISSFSARDPKGSRLSKKGEQTPAPDLNQAVEVGRSFGLDDELWDREWSSLSGGESQRMVLAVAIGLDAAEVLLLDEPTSALDPQSSNSVETYLTSELKSPDSTLKAIVWITHSEEQGRRVGTRFVEITPDGIREEPNVPEV